MEQNKLTEIISEEAWALDVLDKDFKTTVSNMLKEIRKQCMNKMKMSIKK